MKSMIKRRIRNSASWIRGNLFNTPLNSALTIVALLLMYWLIPPFLDWALWQADFSGTTRESCDGSGACWVFIKVYLPQFLYGFYPEEERWRINAAIFILVILVVSLLKWKIKYSSRFIVVALIAYPIIAYVLFYGGMAGLPVVETSEWGGLFLTLVVAISGIVGAFPLGVLLALGRRSEMPITRAVCTVFIEIWRGVPLITVLFMASVMLPLFLPQGVNFDKLLRALFGIMLFAGAYMAEVVRGGLQGIPNGQYEAAQALGFGYWQQMRLIILPQALKQVIPGIVNTFIGLFKDTTLVLIIGLFDLLGIVQAAATDSEWLGFAIEGYVFAAFIFWCFCYGMSRYSQSLEKRLNTSKAKSNG